MNRSNDNGLSRAEFEYLYDTDNEEPIKANLKIRRNLGGFYGELFQETKFYKCQ